MSKDIKRALAFFLFILFGTGLSSQEALSATASGRLGEVVPLFHSEDIFGNDINLRNLVLDKKVVVFFWSFQQPMSIREMNFLDQLYSDYRRYGLEILAIDGEGAPPERVREKMDKLQIIGTTPSYIILADPGGKLARQYRVLSTPQIFLVTRTGKTVFHLGGFKSGDETVLEGKVKEFLGLIPSSPPAKSSSAPERDTATPKIIYPGYVPEGGTTQERDLFEKHYYFGNYYYNKGEMVKAIENYQKCLEINPNEINILLRVGEAYIALKDYENARGSWESVLKIDPTNAEADSYIRRLIRGEF